MLDNDDLTYSYPKRRPRPVSKRALITQERAQKLDLLIHLLTNLQQSIVICGPEGIGKTALLKELQAHQHEVWHFCNVQASSALSFESLTQQLGQSLELSYGNQLDLNALRRFCERQTVILIIDDAGQLVPGLVSELVRFAEAFPGLRVIFAMRDDILHLKSASEDALNDCHLIEMPPLNRKQCLDFLKNFSVQSDSPLALNAITDALVDELYRSTHGVPGKLLAEFPKLEAYQKRRQPWLLALGVIVILATSGYVALSLLPKSSSSETSQVESVTQTQPVTEPANEAPVAKVPAAPSPLPVASPALETPAHNTAEPTPQGTPITTPATEMVQPNLAVTVSNSTKPLENPITGVEEKKSTPAPMHTAPDNVASSIEPPKKAETIPQTAPKDPIPSPALAQENTQAPAKVEPVLPPQPTSAGDDDSTWIDAQAGERYTLQVVTLSSEKAVQRFMARYAEYAESLKYYIVNRGSQPKFVIIYGTFESASEARQSKQTLPAEFRRALEKSFSSLQKGRR